MGKLKGDLNFSLRKRERKKKRGEEKDRPTRDGAGDLSVVYYYYN